MNLPNASVLSNYPGLIPWLVGREWISEFEPSIVSQGHGLTVTSIQLTEEEEGFGDGDHLLVQASVKDSAPKPHRTRLFLFMEYQRSSRKQTIHFDMDCSCLRGYACNHAVAVLETLRNIIATPPAAGPAVNAALAAWLRKIKDAGTASPPQSKPAKPYNKFLAYCIEPAPYSYYGAETQPYFSTRIGNRNKTGFSIDSSVTNADPSRFPKYMAAEDILVCARFQQRNRKYQLWGGSVSLDGGDWDEILEPALATGRLYRGEETEEVSRTRVYTRIQEGPPLTIEASWDLLAGGHARPILTVPSPAIQIIPTDPLRYLDRENNLLGNLQSHLPHAILTAWASGPIVPAENIHDLSKEIADLSKDNPLPLPAEKPARVLAGLSPVPTLHVTNILVGIFQKRHIGAIVRFQYPGSQPLQLLAENEAPRATWFDGETRVVLERDREAEMTFYRSLKNHGLTPLLDILPAQDLNDRNRHSVVLEKPSINLTEWLEFLDSPSSLALEAEGWVIDADPKLGLSIHDVHDFFPAIETDTDHGIDWFRFDVTGQFEGKQISLIPQIARAIAEDWHLRYPDLEKLPETILIPCDKPTDGHIRFPAKRFLEMVEQVRHLFHGNNGGDGPVRLDRLSAAGLADALAIDSSETTRSLANLGRNLRDIHGLPPAQVPTTVLAELRHYQIEGFRWLQFLARHGLHGILADDMGLGKTLQTLAHLVAESENFPGKPSLVVAPTSVVPNWAAEAEKFAPHLKVLVLHGVERADNFEQIPASDIVLTSYPLLVRDYDILSAHQWQTLVLDEAQYIKNPKAISAQCACKLKAANRLCLSGTPMENHLGELWSLMRFLMPGFLADEKTFNTFIRKPIERDHSHDAQLALNRRVSPLILRRTKDQVATELPEKTTLIHGIDLTPKQTDLYESVRAAMDARVRDAIADKGLAKSHIIVLDALLKLRQICCHPQLLKSEAAQRVLESAKLEYLTQELLPTLLEEGRRILLFSQFTSMLALIEEHLQMEKIPYLKLTGQTKERANLVKKFQSGEIPIFLISLKAGGTGLNLTAADTIIHYDPWWNPAAENQATDRAHRIGQTKPVFVHKLVCRGTIEDRILELQKHKSALVEALLS
jgi:hypothetical protein